MEQEKCAQMAGAGIGTAGPETGQGQAWHVQEDLSMCKEGTCDYGGAGPPTAPLNRCQPCLSLSPR